MKGAEDQGYQSKGLEQYDPEVTWANHRYQYRRTENCASLLRSIISKLDYSFESLRLSMLARCFADDMMKMKMKLFEA